MLIISILNWINRYATGGMQTLLINIKHSKNPLNNFITQTADVLIPEYSSRPNKSRI